MKYELEKPDQAKISRKKNTVTIDTATIKAHVNKCPTGALT